MDTMIGANTANLIMDTTDAEFGKDVMEASQSTPVIAYFSAPWCGPCKQLSPMLEKVVKAANGAIRMVKINIDENPMIAQQLRVQSIPAVFGFVGGRPVDGFMGAVPESQIKSFAEKLITMSGGEVGPDPIEQALEQAQQAEEAGDLQAAASIYTQILNHDQTCVEAAVGLAQLYINEGQPDAATQLLDQLSDEVQKDQRIVAVRASMELAGEAAEAQGKLPALQAAIAADPDDFQARIDLAVALFAGAQAEEAMDHLFHVIAKDREWNEDAARMQLLKFFEALGPTDPVTLKGRRRLSSILFS